MPIKSKVKVKYFSIIKASLSQVFPAAGEELKGTAGAAVWHTAQWSPGVGEVPERPALARAPGSLHLLSRQRSAFFLCFMNWLPSKILVKQLCFVKEMASCLPKLHFPLLT